MPNLLQNYTHAIIFTLNEDDVEISILQILKINIGKSFCMNTSMSGTQQQMLTCCLYM